MPCGANTRTYASLTYESQLLQWGTPNVYLVSYLTLWFERKLRRSSTPLALA
jgi:hypothetical protein